MRAVGSTHQCTCGVRGTVAQLIDHPGRPTEEGEPAHLARTCASTLLLHASSSKHLHRPDVWRGCFTDSVVCISAMAVEENLCVEIPWPSKPKAAQF